MGLHRKEIDARLERYRSVAKGAGIKLTPQRLEIFRIIAASDEHPSAEAIHKAVQERLPSVSLDTVYRTLWLLSDLGLLTTLGQRQGSVRFDANLDHHHHYLCVRCGLLRDFESGALNDLPIPETVNRFGQVLSAHVEVRGVCARCARDLAESEEATSSSPKAAPPPSGDDG